MDKETDLTVLAWKLTNQIEIENLIWKKEKITKDKLILKAKIEEGTEVDVANEVQKKI